MNIWLRYEGYESGRAGVEPSQVFGLEEGNFRAAVPSGECLEKRLIM